MGRPKGSLNKATRDVKEAAQVYTKEALDTLVKVMRKGKSEQAVIAASREILDSGHGKPKFEVGGVVGFTFEELVEESVKSK